MRLLRSIGFAIRQVIFRIRAPDKWVLIQKMTWQRVNPMRPPRPVSMMMMIYCSFLDSNRANLHIDRSNADMYITRCQREGTCKKNLHNCNTDGQAVDDECFDRCPRCANAQKHKQASAYLRYSSDMCWQKCMGKRRRSIPSVAVDLIIHSYMRKNTNKCQHT